MNKNTLLLSWAFLFTLCAGLGFIPDATGWGRAALLAVSLIFFVPPFLLLRSGERNMKLLVRNLSAISLGLTLILFIISICTVTASDWLGTFLHALLTIVSAPMICSGHWALSLFLWACLLMLSLKKENRADSTAS